MKFKDWDCVVHFDHYTDNGRWAIYLTDAEDGEPITTATVNLPDEEIEPDQAFIKDYSENQGMLEALEKVGLVKRTGKMVRSGYVEIPIVTILHDPETVS